MIVATAGDTWRVTALTMMGPEELRAAIGGGEAGAWVAAAAACGIAEAQLRLGRMLLEGEGVARDPRAAFACFLSAAGGGNAEAHNMLGRACEHGWGTDVDLAAAAAHYTIAAQAGLDWAQYNLGHMLLSGVGVTQDREAALFWYGAAAAQGHVRAMNLVGRCYEEGWATPKNLNAARIWYRRSARGGYFRGAYNYASLLAEGGCIAGAGIWFGRAIAGAPEPSRSTMCSALARHPVAALRDVALSAARSR